MEVKKSPKADLEKGKTMGILMGMIVGLAVLSWASNGATVKSQSSKIRALLISSQKKKLKSRDRRTLLPSTATSRTCCGRSINRCRR